MNSQQHHNLLRTWNWTFTENFYHFIIHPVHWILGKHESFRFKWWLISLCTQILSITHRIYIFALDINHQYQKKLQIRFMTQHEPHKFLFGEKTKCKRSALNSQTISYLQFIALTISFTFYVRRDRMKNTAPSSENDRKFGTLRPQVY